MSESSSKETSASTTPVAEGAKEVRRHWYVAVVGQNTEKICRDRLIKLGFDAFVASQHETHYWRNGVKREVEVVKITTRVFVYATEAERKMIVNFPFIHSFMVNRSAKPTEFGFHPIAIIPDHEMEMLKFMLYKADQPVQFTERLAKGDHVRVIRGNMTGFEGQIIQTADRNEKYIGINIGYLGCALVHIPPEDVVKV